MKHFRIIRKPNFDGIEPDKIIPNQDINTAASISGLTNTDQLPEGLINLYYTDARVDARISLASVTASNLGVVTFGLFKQKVANDLQFKSLTASSNKILLTDNGNDIGIDVDESNLNLNNISGTLSISSGGTGLTSLGTIGQVLTVINPSTLGWSTPSPGFVNPMTTKGDLIIGDTGGTAIRLGIGAVNYVLTSDGTTATWAQSFNGTVTGAANIGGGSEWFKDLNIDTLEFRSVISGSGRISIIEYSDNITFDIDESYLTLDNIGGILSVTKGGTGFDTYIKGDLIYADITGSSLAKRGIGSFGDVLTVSGSGLPVWAPLSSVPNPYVPTWIKYTVSYADLSIGLLSNDIELFVLPSSGVVHVIKIKTLTQFTGGFVGFYKVSVGITGELDKYISKFDTSTPVGDTEFQISNSLQSESHGFPTSIRVSTESDVNLDTLSSGVVEIWLLMSRTP